MALTPQSSDPAVVAAAVDELNAALFVLWELPFQSAIWNTQVGVINGLIQAFIAEFGAPEYWINPGIVWRPRSYGDF